MATNREILDKQIDELLAFQARTTIALERIADKLDQFTSQDKKCLRVMDLSEMSMR